MAKNVLILCTGNSCRSQMAQVIWQNIGSGDWIAQSAGSKPSGYVHPVAIEMIKELGLSADGLISKSLDEIDLEAIDLAVTVCDNAKDDCPMLPAKIETLHWPFDDPADATGSDEEIQQVFRRVREEISDRIGTDLNSTKDT